MTTRPLKQKRLWRLSKRKATYLGLELLGEKAWRIEVSFYRWRWAATLSRLACTMAQHANAFGKRRTREVLEIALEPYVAGDNVISIHRP